MRNMGRQRVGGGYMTALLGRLERYGMVNLGGGGENLHAAMVAAKTAREAQEVQ